MWTGDGSIDDAWARLDDLRLTVRANWLGLMLWMAACLGSGLLYVHVVKPDFIATVQLVLQPRRVAIDRHEETRQVEQTALDGEQADTELGVIRSERLLRSVFDALGMAANPELREGVGGFWSGMSAIADRLSAASRTASPDAIAFARFGERISARRLGLSYVIEIAYRAHDPRVAVRVVNAIASAYVRDRIGEAVANSGRGASATKGRLLRILAESLTAGHAVTAGTVPLIDLPSADVRLMGPAMLPGGKAFPKLVPLVMLTAGIGFVTGALGLMLRDRCDTRVRSRTQLARRLGPDVLGHRPPSVSPPILPSMGAKGDWLAGAVQGSQIAVLMGDQRTGAPALGVVSWAPSHATHALATGLADRLAAAGEAPLLLNLQTPQDARSGRYGGHRPDEVIADRDPATTAILILPPLMTSLEVPALVALVDAIILVVDVDRTTYPEIRLALAAIRTMRGTLAAIVVSGGGKGLRAARGFSRG